MLSVTPHFPSYTFMVAQAPGQDAPFYNRYLMGYSNVTLIKNSTYDLLSIADAALVTSGTATLETALFKVPEVVCYKTSKFSYQIAKWLVKIKFISLVNLIMDKEIVAYRVSDIVRACRRYMFTIEMVFADETTFTVAVHEIYTHQSLELFEYHHTEMVKFYESLDLS